MRSSGRFIIFLVALLFVNLLLGRLSLELSATPEAVSIIWLPAGAALVALVFIDLRLWPSITIAALVTNISFGLSVQSAIGISIGSTLGAVISAYGLRGAVFFKECSMFSKCLKLGTIGASVSAIVSATFGVVSLFLAKSLTAPEIFPAWGRWWVGDFMGIFLFSSFTLLYFMITHDAEDVS